VEAQRKKADIELVGKTRGRKKKVGETERRLPTQSRREISRLEKSQFMTHKKRNLRELTRGSQEEKAQRRSSCVGTDRRKEMPECDCSAMIGTRKKKKKRRGGVKKKGKGSVP